MERPSTLRPLRALWNIPILEAARASNVGSSLLVSRAAE
jgi:hypothetical protein